jgi:hypothetical protein
MNCVNVVQYYFLSSGFQKVGSTILNGQEYGTRASWARHEEPEEQGGFLYVLIFLKRMMHEIQNICLNRRILMEI